MKWIKSRELFINEAKVRDVIFPRQAKEVAKIWGEKYLDYEEILPTSNIEQGKWLLSKEDKYEALKEFTGSDIEKLFELFNSLPEGFVEFISTTVFNEKVKDINIKSPTLDEMCVIFDSIFKKISVNDSISNNVISKDENGVPLRDEGGNMIKVEKTAGELVLSNNLVNINAAITDYNTLVDKYVELKLGNKYKLEDKIIPANKLSGDQNLANFINYARSNENRDFKYDFEIFNKDIYLSIKHNPKDILNMSISKFYASCQHLYTGGYRDQLLGNVFDPNSIPAFLIFDTPIFQGDEKISDTLPLSRMVIRNLESLDNKKSEVKLFFDRAYPDRMQSFFVKIVEKYTSNKNIGQVGSNWYVYSPDLGDDAELKQPYHDRFGSNIKRVKYIGINTKTLYLNKLYDWKNVKVAANSSIKELVIETTDIPVNLLDIPLNLDWVKFKLLELKTLKPFSKIKFDSIAFDKCKFAINIFNDINKSTPNIKKIKLTSCDNVGVPNFGQFSELEELHLLYTLDSLDELEQALIDTNLKKLVVSGDLITKESKEFFSSIKSKGIKLEIVGPVI